MGKLAFATIDQLLSKPARTREVRVDVNGDKVTIKLQAIGSKEYDALLAAHPPTKAQKADGGVFNPDTFGPALLAKSMVDPVVSDEQATELWNSDLWSRGELSDLFYAAVELNNKGMNVPFTEPD